MVIGYLEMMAEVNWPR